MRYLELLGGMFISAAVGLIVAMPFALVYKIKAVKKRGVIQCLMFCFIISFIFSATETPDVFSFGFSAVNIGVTPFAIKNTAQLLLNVLLFMPLGFFAPLMWKRYRNIIRTFFLGVLFSLFIEVSQIFCHRVSDIDDLLMNTLGCLLGYSAYMPIRKLFPKISGNPSDVKSEMYVYIAIVFITSFLIKPLIIY